ncbi:aldo/keto reductase [Phaeobacter sp. C3_T13_0]|uniref:aldo/keto reductase n=1 Tax=Phaeobacter cretensis TaxID=3342641 RepID=UPI0039BD0E91
MFELRQIGQTKVSVTSVAFGCASIGNLYREATEAEAQAVLDSAWRSDIRYFDTAPHYGRGRSEQRLGRFLVNKPRDDYALSTKVGRVLSAGAQRAEADSYINPLPNDMRYDYSGDGIESALEGSRSRLGSTYIDIVYVHDIGTYTHGTDNAAHMDAFLGDGYERLVRLKEKGAIGAIGLGVNENEICIEIMKDHPLDVILLAGRLTLLDRSAEETLVPMCHAAGTSLVLGGVFNSGVLATGPIEGATYDYGPASGDVLAAVTELQAKAESLSVPLSTAALQFAKCHPQSASVLIGTAEASMLLSNLAALEHVPPEGFAQTFTL